MIHSSIQQHLLNPMSRAIVSGNYGPGDTVEVDVEGDDIVFERIPGPDPDADMDAA